MLDDKFLAIKGVLMKLASSFAILPRFLRSFNNKEIHLNNTSDN